MVLILVAGAVAIVAVVAVSYKSVIKSLVMSGAWPEDKDIGTIPVLSVNELKNSYQGKRVLIVGGTRGVGFGVAQAAVRAGAKVTIVGRNQATAEAAIKTLGGGNGESEVQFIQGDIGTVANAKETVKKIVESVSQKDNDRYDYLVVTAAVWPDWSGRPHAQEDGVETPFAVAVVGRYIVYQSMPQFLKPTARVLNVLASGQAMKTIDIDRDLSSGKRPPKNVLHSVLNYSCGNELVMQLVDADPQLNQFTRVSTHPGYLDTELHDGQGLFFDAVSKLLVHTVGITVEECGLQQASILASPKLHDKGLSFVSCDQKGRVTSDAFKASVQEHLPWLREFLKALL